MSWRTCATTSSSILAGVLQPKAGLKSGGKPPLPPTIALAPLRGDGEGPFCKVAVQSLV